MILSSGGFQLLISFLEKDYEENKDLAFVAIDSIKLTKTVYSDDFDWNTLLIHYGFLESLSKIFEHVLHDEINSPKKKQKYFTTSLDILEIISKETDIGIKQVFVKSRIMD